MFRHQADSEAQDRRKQSPRDCALLIIAALYALLPFGRLVFTGEANQIDMGIATIVLFLVVGSVLDMRRRRHPVVVRVHEERP